MTSPYFTYDLCGWLMLFQVYHYFVFIAYTGVGNLCGILEELFDRTEMPGEEDGEEGGTCVPFSSIKHLSEELMAEDSKNTLHLVPVGHIVKLLDILNCNILQAVNRVVNDEDDVRFLRISYPYIWL